MPAAINAKMWSFNGNNISAMQKSTYLNLTTAIDENDHISKRYKNKNVFITGASGFMGKVLLEKLLRTCPDIGNIYILLRESRGKTLKEKVAIITDNTLFDNCRQLNPGIFNKIIPLLGDVRDINLGIDPGNRQLLINEVSFVYHLAATVRFNESLTDAIVINTRGTREVCRLVLDLKHVDGFVHVSTTYSQVDKQIVEEELYRAPVDWAQMIAIAEKSDDHHVKINVPHLLFGYPNTYTFSKALAENVVADMCEGKVPTVILRPSIVSSVYTDPIPGWHDNMNGPNGLIIASSKGVWRSNYVKNNAKLDMVPVDFVISAMILAVWINKYININKISVFNAGCEGFYTVSPKRIMQLGYKVLGAAPPMPLWYPCFYLTESKFIHLCNIYLFHVFPALIIDTVLRIANQKPIVFNVQRKIYSAVSSLEYFSTHSWIFRNEKTVALFDYITEHDLEAFYIDLGSIDQLKFFIKGAEYVISLLLKEDIRHVPTHKKILIIMKIVHFGAMFGFVVYLSIWAYNWTLLPCLGRLSLYLDSL